MDIRQGKHVPRDGYTIPTEHAEPVGVSRNHTVFDIATRQIADERTDAAARAPYCARAPAIDNRRVRMSEPSDEAAVVAAVGSYVAEQLLMDVPPSAHPIRPPTYSFPATVPETETHSIIAWRVQPKSPR